MWLRRWHLWPHSDPQGQERGWRPSWSPVANNLVTHACATASQQPRDADVRTLESSGQVPASLRLDRGVWPCLSHTRVLADSPVMASRAPS